MDTLAIHRRLVDAGAEPRLAEAISTSVRDAVDGHAASKADLRDSEQRLRLEIKDAVDKMTVRFGLMFAAGATLLFVALELAIGR